MDSSSSTCANVNAGTSKMDWTPHWGPCIAGQIDGVNIRTYKKDDCTDDPNGFVIASNSCFGGHLRYECNGEDITLNTYNSEGCTGNIVSSSTFKGGDDKCHSELGGGTTGPTPSDGATTTSGSGSSLCYPGGMCSKTDGCSSRSIITPNGCGSTPVFPVNECFSYMGYIYKFECTTWSSYTMTRYVDSQCTQAIPGYSQTSTLSQSNCENGVRNTCGGQNQPPSQEDPNDKPTTPDYAVSHTIVLQGITVAQFNSDPLIVKSFRQAIAVLLDVPTTDIINILAQQSKSRRVLRDIIVQRRNLETSSCR